MHCISLLALQLGHLHYTLYAILSKRIEHKLTYIANKMDFILGVLTGILAVGNAVYLLS